MSIKLSDVAIKAGVSSATVSRVINNLSGYSDETRRKVEAAIKDLGYKPNAVARGLAGGKTHTIGVLQPSLSSRFSAELIHGIENEAHRCGYSVIICNTDSNGERTMEYLRILSEKRVDGIIFASEWVTGEYGGYLQEMGIPVVLVSTYSPQFGFPYVRVDDRQAAYSAARYLIDHGHQRIGFISGRSEDPIAGGPRIDGFTSALRDAGLSVDSDYFAYGDFHFASGRLAMETLWNRRLGLTAVFTSSDEMALGALSFLHENEIRVPDEISLIGYDDTLDALMAMPALTTLHQPIFEMGKKAVQMLFETGKVNSIIMQHTITERKSVKSI